MSPKLTASFQVHEVAMTQRTWTGQLACGLHLEPFNNNK